MIAPPSTVIATYARARPKWALMVAPSSVTRAIFIVFSKAETRTDARLTS